MTWASIEARIQRLDGLARGLAREVMLWKSGKDPLLHACLKGLDDALSAVEATSVALVRASQARSICGDFGSGAVSEGGTPARTKMKSASPSLFESLFDFHPREDHTPKENFLTEALAYLLKTDHSV